MTCVCLLLRLVCIIIMKPSASQDPKRKKFQILPSMVVGPRLFIYGLQNADIEQVFELFSRYGQVVDLFFPKDSRKYAFVQYQRTSQAMRAIEELHDTVQFENKLHVRFSKRRAQDMDHGCYCQCHAEKGKDTAQKPLRKKKISTIFDEMDPFAFRKASSRAPSAQKVDHIAKANNSLSLDETREESIDHPAQAPSLDQPNFSPTIEPKPFKEFTLNYEQDDQPY